MTDAPRAKRVLFLCTGNSCRSQMAEAVLGRLGAGLYEAVSAGTEPAGVHPLTIEVLREAGYDTAPLRSKHIDEVAGGNFDLVITLCDSARQSCPFFPGGGSRMHWNIPDPAAVRGTPDEVREAFRAALSDLTVRIRTLITGQSDFLTPGGAGSLIDGVRHLSPSEAFDAVSTGGALIVDLRHGYETGFRVFQVPEVVYLPRREFLSGFSRLPMDRPLILTDAIGLWSIEAVRLLQREGYSNVANLSGGIIDWERAGLPVRKDPGFELTGQCTCRLKSPKGGSPHEDGEEALSGSG
jgi:arsenate reductase (thioredoxin)